MKIGIFTNNYLPNPYGVTGSIESFRKVFESLGHEVFVFAPRWKGYSDENRKVFRYPSLDMNIKFRFPLAFSYSRRVDKVLENLDLDIIHSQHPNLLGTAAMKWARKKKIPLVFTWHTLYDRYTNFIPFLPKKFSANWIIKKAVKYANACDQIVIPTESIRKIIQDWGVENKNITAVPTGVDEKDFENADGKSIRKKYGIRDDEILLLLVSRLTEEKNVEFLFDAVIDILKNNSHVKFMLAGGGYLVSKLKKKALDNNLSEKVIFTGEIKRKEVKNYYAAGDIFVCASKSETQGMLISEAMYIGLPIVAVKATGVSDLVEDNRSGFLVAEEKKTLSETVEKLIKNKNLCKTFSEESKKIAKEKYISKICAQKMLSIYEKLINEI